VAAASLALLMAWRLFGRRITEFARRLGQA